MRRFSAVLFATGAVLAAVFVRAETPATLTDEQQLIALEQEWINAEKNHDVATLERILDDQFVSWFGSSKPIGKKAFIAEVTDGPLEPTLTHTVSDYVFIINGDTAVVMETDAIRRIKDGQPRESIYRFTTTYIRRDGRWRALAEQSVKVPATK